MISDESIPLNPPSKQLTWTWRDLVIILLGTVFLLAAGGALFYTLAGLSGQSIEELAQPTILQSLALAALEAVALVAGIYLFGLRRKRLGWDILGVKPVSKIWVLITVTVSVLAIPLTGLITILVMLVLGMPLENPQLEFLLPDDISGFTAVLMLLLVGIVVPIAEELIFRGFLYTFLKERWGVWPGVLISSLIFGIIHADIAVGVTAFFLGILLALVFEYSRSLWTSILVHAINNSAKIGLLYILIKLGLDNLV